MNAVSALMLTAAATLGTIRAAKALRRALRNREAENRRAGTDGASPPIIDLVRDESTGVFSRPK